VSDCFRISPSERSRSVAEPPLSTIRIPGGISLKYHLVWSPKYRRSVPSHKERSRAFPCRLEATVPCNHPLWPGYNERRKFKISCCCDGLSALKLLMTPSASELQLFNPWLSRF